jgi:hypothetical protein
MSAIVSSKNIRVAQAPCADNFKSSPHVFKNDRIVAPNAPYPALATLDRYHPPNRKLFACLSADERTVLDAVIALNRSLYGFEEAERHFRYFGQYRRWASDPEPKPCFHRPTLWLLAYARQNMKALRDCINRHPLATLRLSADLTQVRKRWFRNLERQTKRTGAR